MNIPLILITYTTGFIGLVTIIYTFSREGFADAIHNVYYAGITFSLAWCISYLVMYLTTDPEIAAAAYRAGSIGWTANFSLMFLLCIKLLESISGKRMSAVPGYLVVCVSLIFFIAALRGEIFATEFTRMPGGWWAEHIRMDSPWVIAYMVWSICLFLAAAVALYITIRRARLKRHRRQILFILSPLGVVTFLAIVINLIGPMTGREYPPLGHILILGYLVFVGYAIVKFRGTAPDPGSITGPLLFQISDMVILTDSRGIIVRINHAVSDLLGYEAGSLISGEVTRILPGIQPLCQGEDEREAVMVGGESLPVHCTVTPIDDIHGDRIGFFFLLKDLRQLRKMEELTQVLWVSNRKLEHLSVTDALTGIFNRKKITDELAQEILRSRRYGSVFSLILYDVDHFKNVNDTYGHAAGDMVLRTMSEVVRMNIRETDILGRWGGEEFLIICVNTDRQAAGSLAEKIRSRFEEYEYQGIGRVTASFGITSFMETDSEDSILERVDRAMYDAKHHGRNTVSIL